MKPPPFEYCAPASLDEVLDVLGEHGDDAKIVAGGQSLMPLLAMRLSRPAQLVDLNAVSSLERIDLRDGNVVFGAMTRERQAERSELVGRRLPLLVEALPLIGHVTIRNRGTIGGSMAHADASAELPAVALLTEAVMTVRSRAGERRVLADEFFMGHFTTALAPEEVLVEVEVPIGPPDAGWSFQEVARRHGDFALVGAAAMVTRRPEAMFGTVRLCLFGVADRAVRARAAEAALAGATVSDDTIRAAAAEAVRDLEPASDMHGSAAFRRHLAEVTVRRVLTAAVERAGGPR